ncbi:MAG: universal stress protein [Devosia sp.]|uniref:universal stress protein n=1 Tax=Devosia sp. TaxID=1871048 RepID=UPI001ACD744C|nr:universal stress protein [Devosia sp.]MBN9309955.1 universal stress protein [Devosia sp.]MBN9314369.1 universal stress protein [Devosia sp.]
MYSHILVAVDGSDLAGRALDHALQLAKALGSQVTVVTVTEPAALVGGGYGAVAGTAYDPIPELIEAQEQGAKALLAKAVETAKAAGIDAKTAYVSDSFPAEGIISTANDIKADLIVMGSHGRRGFGRLLLGSQTNNVLAHTTIPVLVTR